MANIKYGRTNGVTTIPVTSDPYATLGAAIGTMLGNNYYERGVAKGDAEGTDAFNAAANYGAAPQLQNGGTTLQQMYSSNNGYSPYAPQGTPLSGQGVPDDLYNQAVTVGAVTLDGNDLANVNKLISNINAAQNGITVGSVLPQNSSDYSYNYTDDFKEKNSNGQRDLKAEKLDYIAQKYSGLNPNPDGDAIAVNSITDKAGAKIADTDFSKLPTVDVASLQAAIRKELRKNGRNSAQIEQVIKNLTPQIQAKAQQANEAKLQGLTSTLNRQINDGDLDNAALTYARISQISKPFAQALGNKLKLAQDSMTADQQYEYKVNSLMKRNGWDRQTASNYVQFGSVIDPKAAYNIGLANRTYGRNSGYGRSSGDGSDSGNNKGTRSSSIFKDPDYVGVTALADKYQKQLDEFDENAYPNQQAAATAKARLQQQALYYQAMQEEMLATYGVGMPMTVQNSNSQPAGNAEGQSANASVSGESKAKAEPQLTDKAEQERQRGYNRGEILKQARRAGFGVGTWNNKITPAGWNENPSAEQREAFEQFRERYKDEFPELFY